MMDDFMGDFLPRGFEGFMNPLNQTMRKALHEMERALPAVQSGFDWAPTADISENKDSYVIHANLPGVKKDNIKIEVDHNILTIRGERANEREEKNEDTKFYKTESTYGSFMRRFTLPEDIDPKKIKAVYKDGVLGLTIPKPPESEAVQVQIEDESSQPTNNQQKA